jgi:hypothetical protein
LAGHTFRNGVIGKFGCPEFKVAHHQSLLLVDTDVVKIGSYFEIIFA